jgi:hypothetical protein
VIGRLIGAAINLGLIIGALCIATYSVAYMAVRGYEAALRHELEAKP